MKGKLTFKKKGASKKDDTKKKLDKMDKKLKKHEDQYDDNTVGIDEVKILTFEQFMNEDEDFKDKFSTEIPNQDEDGGYVTNDNDTNEPSASAEPTGDEEDEDAPEVKDSWNLPDEGGEDFDAEPAAGDVPTEVPGQSRIEKTNQALTQVTAKIGELLDNYKAGGMSIEQYKNAASPYLAQRKELQAKMDKYFNVGMSDDDDLVGAGMGDDLGATV